MQCTIFWKMGDARVWGRELCSHGRYFVEFQRGFVYFASVDLQVSAFMLTVIQPVRSFGCFLLWFACYRCAFKCYDERVIKVVASIEILQWLFRLKISLIQFSTGRLIYMQVVIIVDLSGLVYFDSWMSCLQCCSWLFPVSLVGIWHLFSHLARMLLSMKF